MSYEYTSNVASKMLNFASTILNLNVSDYLSNLQTCQCKESKFCHVNNRVSHGKGTDKSCYSELLTASIHSFEFTWIPGGYFHIRRSGAGGGLGAGIEFRGKIWGKVQSSSPNKRKNLGSSVATTRKNWERITIWGAFEVISEIQRAKFGVSVTYIFGGKI